MSKDGWSERRSRHLLYCLQLGVELKATEDRKSKVFVGFGVGGRRSVVVNGGVHASPDFD